MSCVFTQQWFLCRHANAQHAAVTQLQRRQRGRTARQAHRRSVRCLLVLQSASRRLSAVRRLERARGAATALQARDYYCYSCDQSTVTAPPCRCAATHVTLAINLLLQHHPAGATSRRERARQLRQQPSRGRHAPDRSAGEAGPGLAGGGGRGGAAATERGAWDGRASHAAQARQPARGAGPGAAARSHAEHA